MTKKKMKLHQFFFSAFSVSFGQKLCLYLGAALFGAMIGSVVATSNAEDVFHETLEVYPPSITVSPNYPARIVVGFRRSDGTWIDASEDPSVTFQLDRPELLRLGDDRTLHVQETKIDGDATSELTIRYQGQELKRSVSVTKDIAPTFAIEVSSVLSRSGCNVGTCHGNLHGKGGFRLSLRGDDAWQDYSALLHDSNARRLNFFKPSDSLLLKKPTTRVSHQGGKKLEEDSIGHAWIKEWIERGAVWSASKPRPASAPEELIEEVERLEVYPKEAWIEGSSRKQPLTVIASFRDGKVRDITPWARLESSDISRIQIDNNANVLASGAVETTVSVLYLNARASSRLVFLPSGSKDQSKSQENLAVASNEVDRLILDRLDRMQLAMQPEADSYTFLRRLCLTTIGRLPTPEELRRWDSEAGESRTEVWVERLLSDPGYDWMWALHWSDLLRNEPKVMSRKGAILWNRWLHDQSAVDRPLNEMVEEMVASVGSTYENPPASFHRTHRDPTLAAESIGQVFLGVRLQCAKCHNHPFDRWKQDDYYGLAAYFTSLDRKQIDNKPADGLDSHVITGDEIISLSSERLPKLFHPGRSKEIDPRPLPIEAALGQVTVNSHEKNPLAACGAWLTRGNRQFARNMANRVWYHFWGRGIVDPPDDFRDSNPASNPELLEYLTDELIRSNYSTRHLARLILTSRAFASGSIPGDDGSVSLPGLPVFAGYGVRRIPAEVLLDAVSDATAVPHSFAKGKSEAKDDGGLEESLEATQRRAIALAPNPRASSFLKAFGKPDRTLICECERSSDASLSQSLLMLNGDDIRQKVSNQQNRIAYLLTLEPEQAIEELFLATLTRPASDREKEALMDYLRTAADRRSAMEDILWAQLNSKEFSLLR